MSAQDDDRVDQLRRELKRCDPYSYSAEVALRALSAAIVDILKASATSRKEAERDAEAVHGHVMGMIKFNAALDNTWADEE
jgi:hypothetical protein